MSMLDNWEKTSFSEKRRYYTKNESGSFYCDEDGALIWFEAAEKNQLSQPPFGFGSFVPKRCMKTLREIGPGALMCNYIHVLRIPQGMLHPKYPVWGQTKTEGSLMIHGRQFRETIINTLIVPKGYPYKELMHETKINNIVYSD